MNGLFAEVDRNALVSTTREQWLAFVGLGSYCLHEVPMAHTERFLVDEAGKRVAVVLDVDDYERLLAQAEELESIRAYDAAKVAGDVAVPLDEALREIERRKA